MASAETEGMSIAALIWSVITLLMCTSGTTSIIVDAAVFHDFGQTLTQDERWRLVAVFLAAAVLPMTAILMGQVGKNRAVIYGTHGRGLGEAAQILAMIAILILALGAVATLAIVTSDT